MAEQGTRVDRLVSIDVVERFEALQDEVDLLKNEIKQTLVDMREYMMKDRTVFAQPETAARQIMPTPLPLRVIGPQATPPRAGTAPANGHDPVQSFRPIPHGEGMDPLMLGRTIHWLGTVQDRGLSLQQVTPFLEAYEASGYLPPIMLKVLLRSLADLDQLTDTPPDQVFSPERYAECISELHDIICAADSLPEHTVIPIDPAPENAREEIDQAGQIDYGPAHAELDGDDANEAEDLESREAGRYNLTTIQVPEPASDLGNREDGGVNG
jgi:hypothetical protein